mgnify:FL=1
MKLICITGPTATGKTRLGVDLSLELEGEVISCDSMQVYRGMDIGTAKATEEEMRGVPHHMLDVVSPKESYSVGRYVQEAGAWAEDIAQRGKMPVVVGGTGLYMDSLVRGIDFAESPGDDSLRRELEGIGRSRGGEALLDMLKEFDPEAAACIHPNNLKRIIRAIEIYRLTGKTITRHDEESRLRPDAFEAVRIVLSFEDREKLYERIDRRVDIMMERGLLEEVRALLEGGLSRESTAMAAIGYKELAEYLDGECSLEDAVQRIKQDSRRYAKRQLTWFRRYGDAKWIYVDKCRDFEEVRQIATDFIRDKMR